MKSSQALQGELLGAMKETLVTFFGRATPLETWGVAVISVLIFAVVYKVLARACGLQSRMLLVLPSGFFLMLLASALTQVLWTEALMPRLTVVFVVFLAVVLPLTGVIQKSSWITSLLLWGVTLFVAVALFYIESAISQEVHKGVGSGSQYKMRHEQLDGVFKGSGQ